jgi:hypothetical protein
MRWRGQRACPSLSARVHLGPAWKRPNGLLALAISESTLAAPPDACAPALPRHLPSINAGVWFYAPASNAPTLYKHASVGHILPQALIFHSPPPPPPAQHHRSNGRWHRLEGRAPRAASRPWPWAWESPEPRPTRKEQRKKPESATSVAIANIIARVRRHRRLRLRVRRHHPLVHELGQAAPAPEVLLDRRGVRAPPCPLVRVRWRGRACGRRR